MSERYTRVFSLAPNLYAEGSPVVIAAGALLKDNYTGSVLVQLKIRNIVSKWVKAVKVKIQPLDVAGKELGTPFFYQYLDLNTYRNQEFGSKVPILLADPTVRGYTVEAEEVIFTDNTVWQAIGTPWETLSGPAPIYSALGSDELVRFYQTKYGQNCVNVMTERKDLWFCACGALNHKEEDRCISCQKEREVLRITPEKISALKEEMTRILEEKRLRYEEERKQAEEFRRKAEEERRQAEEDYRRRKEEMLRQQEEQRRAEEERRLAEEQRLREEAMRIAAMPPKERKAFEKVRKAQKKAEKKANKKKMSGGKKAFIIILVLLLLGVGGYFGTTAVIHMIETEKANQAAYDQAVFYYENGDYENALNTFTALGNYKDSNEWAIRAENTINEGIYQQAVEAAQKGDFKKATELFESLGDFKDSAEQIEKVEEIRKEARYQEALQMLEEEKYGRARSIFEALDGYKDSEDHLSRFYTFKLDTVDGGYREIIEYRWP